MTGYTFTYDDNGNRITANGDNYTTGAGNQTTGDGTFRYEYDAEGNLLFRYVDEDNDGELDTGDTNITEFTWDYRNRLTEVAHKSLFGQSIDWKADYVYDCFNHRVASLYDNDGDSAVDREERYVWQSSSPRPLGEGQGEGLAGKGNVVLDFIDADGAGETSSLDLARRYLWGAAVDQLLAQEIVDDSADDVLYFVRDNLGSTRSLVDYLGQITATYSYDTFGSVTVLLGSVTDSRYLYTCQEYDLTTGSYYYDARWYDPSIGKFVSLDPIGIRGGINLYAYTNNDPIVNNDPTGLWHCCLLSINLSIAQACNVCKEVHLAALWDSGADIQREAERLSVLMYPRDGIRQEAFRHCYAMAVIAKLVGIPCALCAGSAREEYQEACEEQPPMRSRRALENNAIGINICSHSQDPATCCEKELEIGALNTTPDPDYYWDQPPSPFD